MESVVTKSVSKKRKNLDSTFDEQRDLEDEPQEQIQRGSKGGIMVNKGKKKDDKDVCCNGCSLF